MLREVTNQADWADKTMSIMREKQFMACEKRLSAHGSRNLFSSAMTNSDVQALLESSYYMEETAGVLLSLEDLRRKVMEQLPAEVTVLSSGEVSLLERLLIAKGRINLGEWDDVGAAEALVSRLWCSLHMSEEEWVLELPWALHEPILRAMSTREYTRTRELLFRFEAMVMGLLYITGFLYGSQPIYVFTREVMGRDDPLAACLARRHLKSAFEYMTDGFHGLILLHPGLADPYRLISAINREEAYVLELSQEMIAGGMNGLFAEEEPLYDAMCCALDGFLRPEYEVAEATEDLRMLAKQGVSLDEMEVVMASMLCMLPTQAMKQALRNLRQCTPHWIGLKAELSC